MSDLVKSIGAISVLFCLNVYKYWDSVIRATNSVINGADDIQQLKKLLEDHRRKVEVVDGKKIQLDNKTLKVKGQEYLISSKEKEDIIHRKILHETVPKEASIFKLLTGILHTD